MKTSFPSKPRFKKLGTGIFVQHATYTNRCVSFSNKKNEGTLSLFRSYYLSRHATLSWEGVSRD